MKNHEFECKEEKNKMIKYNLIRKIPYKIEIDDIDKEALFKNIKINDSNNVSEDYIL